MCQYSSRCPVKLHHPGTRCRYRRGAFGLGGSLLFVLLLLALLYAKSQGWGA